MVSVHALEGDWAGVEDAFRPYRRLAMHVLGRALLDLSNPAASPSDRESARRFLTGSPMLFHWCRVAALDPRLVARHMATLPAAGGSGWHARAYGPSTLA